MNLLTLLKGKLLVSVVASVVLVGGATVAFAATSAGQTVVQSLIQRHSTVNTNATSSTRHKGQSTDQPNQDPSACPGLPDTQKLAKSYHLSTSSQGAAVLAICALHQGTFKGTASDGTTVKASRVYGYGEIDQLLTYAQYLASHDTTSPGGNLSDANVGSYLATALQSCGTSPLATCLQTHIPNYQPGKHTDNSKGQGHGNKPTATPGTIQNGQGTGQSNQGQKTCPGLPDAQKLAASYHLSTDNQGDAIKAICALHQGTFTGTTSAGISVKASRVYGYGEIDQLLTYAQYLASHDTTSPGGNLSDTNVSSYLAAALQSCGTSPLATCLQTHIPNYQPGKHNGHQPTPTPTP
jgi:hypothetical protein